MQPRPQVHATSPPSPCDLVPNPVRDSSKVSAGRTQSRCEIDPKYVRVKQKPHHASKYDKPSSPASMPPSSTNAAPIPTNSPPGNAPPAPNAPQKKAAPHRHPAHRLNPSSHPNIQNLSRRSHSGDGSTIVIHQSLPFYLFPNFQSQIPNLFSRLPMASSLTSRAAQRARRIHQCLLVGTLSTPDTPMLVSRD